MRKLIVAALAALAVIGLSTLPAASQADRPTAIGRLDMAGLPDLDRNNIRGIQHTLAAKGFDPGPVDGIVGPLTRAAVRKFQDRYGMKASGQIDNQTLFALGKPDLAAH